MNPDLVILFSGGADSILMLEFAKSMKRIPHCVLISYEQLHKEELDFAFQYCTKNEISFQIVNLQGLNFQSALTGEGEKGRFEGVSEYNVPARNTIFLSIASGIAENMGIHEVWLGADMSDREHLFPDCYQDYIIKMNELLKLGLATDVKVNAPLLGFTKEMVLEMLEKQYNVKKEDMYSGYGEHA